MTYQSTKTYGHEIGLSCAFRQWRAQSHCRFIHGYALAFHIVFEADTLDDRNWVVDFGGLKSLKSQLEDMFDHKTVVAQDDPELDWFTAAGARGLIQLRVVEAVGCEKFAEIAFGIVDRWLQNAGQYPRVRVQSVEVREHGANSAAFYQPYVVVDKITGLQSLESKVLLLTQDAMDRGVLRT